MYTHMSKLGAVLMVAVVATWVGGLVTPAVAKKAPAPVARTGQTTAFAAGDDGASPGGRAVPHPALYRQRQRHGDG